MTKWKLWALVPLLLVAGPSFSGETTLSWTAPTGSESCVADPEPANIVGYRIWQMVAEITDISQTSITLNDLPPGDYKYTSSAFRADGVHSRLSGVAEKTVDAMVVTTATVYTMIKQPDRFIFLPLGTIQLGTTCDHTQPLGPYFVVPRAQVIWSGNIRPDVVVAECS